MVNSAKINSLISLTDPIVPIDFTPHDGKNSKVSFNFRWIHAFILTFAAISGATAFFVLTARSVSLEINPITAEIQIEGGFSFQLAQRYLIRTGNYDLTLSNEGYHDTVTQLLVSTEQDQIHPFMMRRLPGVVSFATLNMEGARVKIDGVDFGLTPLLDIPVEPGKHQLTISKNRYLDYGTAIEIEGRRVEQRYQVNLEPAWAVISITTSPSGAEVLVDGALVGVTPLNTEVMQGNRDVLIKLTGHKAWQEDFAIYAGQDFAVPQVDLIPADGLVLLRSDPNAASVTIDGKFQGITPLEVALAPDINHELSFFKNGYYSAKSSIRTTPNQEREMLIDLDPIVTNVRVVTEPLGAELYVDGELQGLANQTIELMAASQRIEIRKDGFVPYNTQFTSRPGLDQVIRVSLKSLEQARLDQIQPIISSAGGQTLKLFYGGDYTMGASRREAGRRPNENLREIRLEKPFYISTAEVSNSQYRLFDSEHSSGTIEGTTLDNEAQPAVQINWTQAALYCNWLSEQESLEPFYNLVGEEVSGFNPDSIGYRLPSEAEWEWIARTDDSGSQLKYPWGTTLPPPENSGNFADITAQHYLGEVMFDYDDGYFASSPVESFDANYYDIYDMAGNVAEWVHDYYGAVGSIGIELDPLGPELGQFHTIRGSSWAHGSLTELRLSFRDFGEESRDDVGFRVARYLEDI